MSEDDLDVKQFPEDIDCANAILDNRLEPDQTVALHGARVVRSEDSGGYDIWVDNEPIDRVYPEGWPAASALSKHIKRLCAIHAAEETDSDHVEVMFG